MLIPRRLAILACAVVVVSVGLLAIANLASDKDVPTPIRLIKTLYIQVRSDNPNSEPEGCISEDVAREQGNWPLYPIGQLDEAAGEPERGWDAVVRLDQEGEPKVLLTAPAVPDEEGRVQAELFVRFGEECLIAYQSMPG